MKKNHKLLLQLKYKINIKRNLVLANWLLLMIRINRINRNWGFWKNVSVIKGIQVFKEVYPLGIILLIISNKFDDDDNENPIYDIYWILIRYKAITNRY